MKLILIPLMILSFACAKEKPIPTPNPVAEAVAADKNADLRAEIIAFARQHMGKPYCYASADPKKGFDCSGFVNYVFRHFDIEVPRSSSGFASVGKTIKPEDFKVGDVLVFTGYRDRNSVGHVGIICEANGMDSKFIHASSGKEMAVIISSLNSDLYKKRFIKGVDVISSH
ncbi:MAG: C40 family peptidase [Flavobacterium sp.]